VSAFYQIDASAVVKRYVSELGSAWVTDLIEGPDRNTIGIADVTRAEVASAFARRTREGCITPDERDDLLTALRGHCDTDYQVVPVTPAIVDLAMELAQRWPLRAYDAVQLATAVTVNNGLVAYALPPLVFLTADNNLMAAALGEGLAADDPNAHP
jgi:predicted nucleic acid-binding protein